MLSPLHTCIHVGRDQRIRKHVAYGFIRLHQQCPYCACRCCELIRYIRILASDNDVPCRLLIIVELTVAAGLSMQKGSCLRSDALFICLGLSVAVQAFHQYACGLAPLAGRPSPGLCLDQIRTVAAPCSHLCSCPAAGWAQRQRYAGACGDSDYSVRESSWAWTAQAMWRNAPLVPVHVTR